MSEQDTANSTRDDPELRAMLAIVRYFAPLDRPAATRVIEWAKDRYVSTAFPDLAPDWMETFTTKLAKAAEQIGNVTPLDLIRLAEEAERVRNEHDAEQAVPHSSSEVPPNV